MRSLVFEGKTWAAYEELREKDKKLGGDLHELKKLTIDEFADDFVMNFL